MMSTVRATEQRKSARLVRCIGRTIPRCIKQRTCRRVRFVMQPTPRRRRWPGRGTREACAMRRTHLSLYYLAGYVLPSGVLLLTIPDIATKLLQSNQTYDEAPLRLAGLVLIALGVLIV